jgi:aminoglycoside phosphotransferase (APT) family kinase protein
MVPEWRLESLWLDRLERHFGGESAAAFVLGSLREDQPEGIETLAHGDFSNQNLVCSPAGIVLVDWEEVGSAAPGFDAGWLLAHARIGASGRSHDQCLAALLDVGFSQKNLDWFESLGLLRLLFRARTLQMDESHRRSVLDVVKREVIACATRRGWAENRTGILNGCGRTPS